MSASLRIGRLVVRAPATASGRRAAARLARIARNELRYALADELAAAPAPPLPRGEVALLLGWDGGGRLGDRALARATAGVIARHLDPAAGVDDRVLGAPSSARTGPVDAGFATESAPTDAPSAPDASARLDRLWSRVATATGTRVPGAPGDAGEAYLRAALRERIAALAAQRLDGFAPLIALAGRLVSPPPPTDPRLDPWPSICAELARPRFRTSTEPAGALAPPALWWWTRPL